MTLTPVPVARQAILDSVPGPRPVETLPLSRCAGRVLACDVAALRTHPPFANSAMDGFAVRAADLAMGTTLSVIGTSAAGRAFDGVVGPGQTVRIFTGAPLPDGADTILMQEHAQGVGSPEISVMEVPAKGRHIRVAGLDFHKGDVLLQEGRLLDSAALGVAAAMGHPSLPVRRKPVVAILATGDELVLPGETVGRDQIVASNGFALAALVEEAGGEPLDLGIARDDHDDLAAKIGLARKAKADILVTLGGASVGQHDLVQEALKRQGLALGFWKIAMRPGKPMMTGRLDETVVLGLPGNPISAIVCGHLFLLPLIDALLGRPDAGRDRSEPATLGCDMPANDEREDYVRATLALGDSGWVATPFSMQDSSMMRTLAAAEALAIRPAGARAAKAGDPCRIIRLR